jgi:hypothetical protein
LDRSAIYMNTLPIFTSGRARLLDNQTAVPQFEALERRTFSTGRERVDTGPGQCALIIRFPVARDDGGKAISSSPWPNAGCSSENATIRASISGAARFARIGFLRLISCNASSPPSRDAMGPSGERTNAADNQDAEIPHDYCCL